MDFEYLTSDSFLIRNFLSPEECAEFIALAEQMGFDEAPVNTEYGAVRLAEIRNNDRVMLDDAALATRLWERAADYILQPVLNATAIGLNERFRFYRYHPGQLFRWHRDGYFRRNERERSYLTFMVYLNDDFTGGETKFETLDVRPERGAALIFRHPLLHEGGEIRTGVKYVLRTDVMYREG